MTRDALIDACLAVTRPAVRELEIASDVARASTFDVVVRLRSPLGIAGAPRLALLAFSGPLPGGSWRFSASLGRPHEPAPEPAHTAAFERLFALSRTLGLSGPERDASGVWTTAVGHVRSAWQVRDVVGVGVSFVGVEP